MPVKHDITLLEQVANDVACGHVPDDSYTHEMAAMWHRMSSELEVFRREVPGAYLSVPVSTDGMPEAPGRADAAPDPDTAPKPMVLADDSADDPDPTTPPKPMVLADDSADDGLLPEHEKDWRGRPLIPGSVKKAVAKSRAHTATGPTKGSAPGLADAKAGEVVAAKTRKRKPGAAPPVPGPMHSDEWSDAAREASAEARKGKSQAPDLSKAGDEHKAHAEAVAKKAKSISALLQTAKAQHPAHATEAAAEAAEHAHRAAEHARAAVKERDPAMAEHHARKAEEHANHAEHALHGLTEHAKGGGHGSKLRELFHLLVGSPR